MRNDAAMPPRACKLLWFPQMCLACMVSAASARATWLGVRRIASPCLLAGRLEAVGRANVPPEVYRLMYRQSWILQGRAISDACAGPL